jgi:hypothetical protein
MARPWYALIVLSAVFLAQAVWGQASLAPQAGVLVLRNGQVIEGDVTRAGDYFVVTKGEGSELRLKAEEVELFCGSLLEAYEIKARRLSGLSAKPHIELAKWCLRHGMHAKCAEQIVAAMRLEPNDPQVIELETRLKLIVATTPPPSVAASAGTGLTTEALEKAVRALPKGSVEKFGAIVQPILLNRCGNNQCHGPNATSQFKLLKPPPGQIVSRRFTQRNLQMAIRYLDPSNPEASPLVMMPQQRHGKALTAVFDKQSAQQLAELLSWARLTSSGPSEPARQAPATIAPGGATLSQPAAAGGVVPAAASAAASDDAASVQPGLVNVRVMRPPLDQPASSPPPSRTAPRDRFDPDIFNRQYHGK